MHGVKTTTSFTCSRCGEKQVLDGTSAQPIAWARVMATRPPLANPLEVVPADREEWLLCDVCHRSLRGWAEGAE